MSLYTYGLFLVMVGASRSYASLWLLSSPSAARVWWCFYAFRPKLPKEEGCFHEFRCYDCGFLFAKNRLRGGPFPVVELVNCALAKITEVWTNEKDVVHRLAGGPTLASRVEYPGNLSFV